MDSNRNSIFSEKLKEQVSGSFDRIRKALDLREKLLLRQLSVVVQQSHHVTFQFDNIKFVDSGQEEDIVNRIRSYGKYNIDNFNIILKDHYENEDYIQPVEDHDLMHKSCRRGTGDEEQENPESEEIIVEFFHNKGLIKEGADMVQESIINLALNESKDLIKKTLSDEMGLELDNDSARKKIDLTNIRNRERTTTELLLPQCNAISTTEAIFDVSNNNNILAKKREIFGIDPTRVARQQPKNTKASQTELDKTDRSVNCKFAPQTNDSVDSSVIVNGKTNVQSAETLGNVNTITMSNYSGTINLKNVANLTINACQESAIPKHQSETSFPQTRCASEQSSPECGFYKRLITENKILRQHILKTTFVNGTPTRTALSKNMTDDSSAVLNDDDAASPNASFTSSKQIPLTTELRSILNLPEQDDTLTQVLGELFSLASPTAIAGESKEHTMQIQQWLKQIISETEIEPLQNSDLMEFSQITN
ncbi:uncharacterized protein LOC128733918 [Sabethes cyaneus]|uniref:uncharacterized protein LOC128733918 n=1 Tax=Sabethes cyaneus TaxID=53552 RepID=UPI00237E2E07|nr:uncharacterized protein LOC128733918 [Sabethes cyaneus]